MPVTGHLQQVRIRVGIIRQRNLNARAPAPVRESGAIRVAGTQGEPERRLQLACDRLRATLEPGGLRARDGHGPDPLELLARQCGCVRLVQQRPGTRVTPPGAYQPQRDQSMDARERAVLHQGDLRVGCSLVPTPTGQRQLRPPGDQVIAPHIEVAAIADLQPGSQVVIGDVPPPQPAGGAGDHDLGADGRGMMPGLPGELGGPLELLQPLPPAVEHLYPPGGEHRQDGRVHPIDARRQCRRAFRPLARRLRVLGCEQQLGELAVRREQRVAGRQPLEVGDGGSGHLQRLRQGSRLPGELRQPDASRPLAELVTELLVAGERPTLCSLRRFEFRDVEELLAHCAEQGRLLLERERVGESRGLLVEDGGLTVGAASGSLFGRARGNLQDPSRVAGPDRMMRKPDLVRLPQDGDRSASSAARCSDALR